MHQSANNTNFEMKLSVPGLADLIDVYRVLTTGDDEGLERLMQGTIDKERLQETIHNSVGYATFEVNGSVRNRPVKNHAALWLLPVVAGSGVIPPTVNTPVQQVWVRNCFGPAETIRSIGVLPSMASVTALKPTDPYVLIEGLTKVRALGVDEQNRLNLQPSSLEGAAGLPTLQFLVGCVERAGVEPEFPSEIDFDFTQKLVMALSLQAGDSTVGVHDLSAPAQDIAVGMPAPFGQAIVQGIVMWLDSLEKSSQVLCWTLETVGGDSVSLQLVLEDRHDGSQKVLSHLLRLWQVGVEGLERIKERCAVWPINVPLGGSAPVWS